MGFSGNSVECTPNQVTRASKKSDVSAYLVDEGVVIACHIFALNGGQNVNLYVWSRQEANEILVSYSFFQKGTRWFAIEFFWRVRLQCAQVMVKMVTI